MKKTKPVSAKNARVASKPSIRLSLMDQVINVTKGWSLSEEDQVNVGAVIGSEYRLRSPVLSDPEIAEVVRLRLADEIDAYLEKNPDRCLVQIELTENGTISPIQHPIVDRKAVMERTIKAALGTSAIATTCPQIVEENVDGEIREWLVTRGRALCFWNAENYVDLKARVQGASGFNNKLDLPTIKVAKAAQGTAVATAWLFEHPERRRIVVRGSSGVKAGRLKPDHAIRLAEVLSQTPFASAVRACGDAKQIVNRVRSKVKAFQHSRSTRGLIAAGDPDAWRVWAALRRSHGDPEYLPVRLDGSTASRAPTSRRRKKPTSAASAFPKPRSKGKRKPAESKPEA